LIYSHKINIIRTYSLNTKAENKFKYKEKEMNKINTCNNISFY